MPTHSLRAGRLAAVAALLAVTLIPAVAHASGPSRPAAGRWRLDVGGSFQVAHNRKSISHFHLKKLAAAFGCGTAPIDVLGSQALTRLSRGGVTNWSVGRSSRKASGGVAPVKVIVRQSGVKTAGTLKLVFDVGGDPGGPNEGELDFGACQLTFIAHH